jgi:HEAT repeat protein
LGKIGDPKALPHLKEALKQAPKKERKNIKMAVKKIRKKSNI